MHRQLLDILVAPGRGGRLKLEDGDHSADVHSGVLVADDGTRFPIREGVPRMVPEHNSSATVDEGATQRSFGAKWAQYREEEKDQLAEFQCKWFDERFGFGDESRLKQFLANKRHVIDAGTGPGLCAARCARLSDARVVGMDLSDSVTAAHRRHAEQANLDYVQGDILDPPFAPASFDFVVADQVLHHTPDCVRAFHTMARLVAPGGQIAAYVYRKKALLRELADEHIIAMTSRLSVDECLELSEQITELGRELSHLQAKVKLERGVPLLGIEPGEHDVQRLIYWTMLKCFWNDELGWHQSVMVNYDWYSPVYRSRHTEEEVLSWCEDAGLEVVNLNVIDSGISVRAARPGIS
jgi:2-polyprenyl-3-methyl-5-hydroxy-6-metoxy-1,4-benzoquinol methylase